MHSEHGILVTQELANVGLVENDDTRRVQFSRIERRPCGRSKALHHWVSAEFRLDSKPQRRDGTHKRHIRHVEHDHTLVFWRVFCYTSQMGFEDMVAVEER